jgi:plasmid stabilization system protein ParE
VAEEIVIEDIFWTDSAKKSFNKIVEYLNTNWTEREVGKFINDTQYLLSNLKRQPEMCRPSLKRKNVRIGIINRHTQVVYHYQPRKKEIVILLFWNFKQNPAKFKY